MYQRSHVGWTKHLDYMILDLFCLNAAFCIAFFIRFGLSRGVPYTQESYRSLLLTMCVIEIIVSLLLSNLSGVLKRGPAQEFLRVFVLSAATLALTALYLFSAHSADLYSRLVVYYTAGLFLILDFAARLIYKPFVLRTLKKRAESEAGGRSVLILTDKAHAEEIAASVGNDYFEHFSLRGVVLTDPDDQTDRIAGVPVVSDLKGAADYICREWIDEVFVYLSEQTKEAELFQNACREMGITIHTVLDLVNVKKSKQFIEELGNRTVLTTAYNYVGPRQAFIKRTMDLAGGIIGSIAAVLIGIVIGPIIYFQSPGPIIFRQKRVGRNGRTFYVLKYRSMVLDAENRKKDLVTENRVSDGRMFKMDFDPRIIGNRILPDGTKKRGIGEFIRRTSLDEFPQFFNVLAGEMSLVGTRPPTLDEWEKYEYHHRARLAVKPGITGLWQVSGRSEITDFEEVVRLDTEYITNFSIGLDLKILLKTIVVLLQRKGAM
ncbi:MAG: sugar transferase [Clostridia bacterium]|nr:sugar transferase [Clostridia bacterium]